eukprot:TRINITY_DN30491_c0_g1_i2.p1 TRINITY_DN30491_c0_g1~~TRINITY_DN30491_c0_g1_i2.p1  ORF type:complete len:289 (-),score=41.74 TRINITY_DN30491_c0_g1_i2:218-1084(-)
MAACLGAGPAVTDLDQESIDRRVEETTAFLLALNSDTVERPTLVYFDIVGIGWPIRACFAMAETELKDVRIPFEDWMGNGDPNSAPSMPLKRLFPNGHVPLYVEPGLELQESLVILEYLGDKFNLMGDTQPERWKVKQVLIQAYDAVFHYDGIFPVNAFKHQKSHEVLDREMHDFMASKFPGKMRVFANTLEGNPSGFMVGTRLSVADLACFNVICNWYKSFDREYFESEFPALDSYIQKIAAVPQIAQYIRSKQAPTTWLPNKWGEFLGRKLTTPEELVGLVTLAEP